MNTSYQFHFSAVTKVEPFRVVETARRMPTDIFPFFLASRVLMLGVDATGMQGLDSHRAEFPMYQSQYGSEPGVDDLYVFHSAMKSTHVSAQMLRMPLGWIEYTLEIAGKVFDAKAIVAKATDWEREFDLKRGTLRTSYRLAGVLVKLESWIVPGTVQPVFKFTFSKPVIVRAYWRATLRTGEKLFPNATLGEFDVTEKVLEPYRVSVGVFGGKPIAGEFGVERKGSGTIWFHFGSSQTGTLKPRKPGRISLRDYWRDHATISTGDARRDWVYHFSLWLCDMGADMRFGVGCSGNFVPVHLGDKVFWDAHYIADGLLHAGGLPVAEQLVGWLHKVMRREGKRPFSWMVHYNGVADEEDTGHTCIAAHAMTAAKVGRHTRDRRVREQCRDIVQTVATYAVENFFRETERGWILAAPSTTDVTFSAEFTEKARNNTFVHCWFLSILAQAVEWGADEPHRSILANFYLEQNDVEYLDQADGRTGERTDSYLPILCYPTEGHRWLNRRKYYMTRMRHEFSWATPATDVFQMPWPGCWGAASDMRFGLPDAAEMRLLRALQFVYGPGYFAEAASEVYLGTSQPYLTTCGSFLTAQSEQYFYSDFHETRLGIFRSLPRNQELTTLSFTGLRGPGLSASAKYSPTGLRAEITGRGQFDIELAIPYQLRGNPLAVRVNGRVVPHDVPVLHEEHFGAENDWRPAMKPQTTLWIRGVKLAGRTRIEIVAARQPEFDPAKVLALDWVGLGRQLAQPDWWLTNRVERFWEELPKARRAVYTDGITPLAPARVELLEKWVLAGGRLLVCFELGNLPFTGLKLEHAAGHRWEITTREVRFGDVMFQDCIRFKGEVAGDVQVLARDQDGHLYCTWRPVGAGGVLWIAAGRPYLTKREFVESPSWREWFANTVRQKIG
ncbi:MAG: hypothetical protein WCS70_05425 [Verrucomicrobiota bacterium]